MVRARRVFGVLCRCFHPGPKHAVASCRAFLEPFHGAGRVVGHASSASDALVGVGGGLGRAGTSAVVLPVGLSVGPVRRWCQSSRATSGARPDEACASRAVDRLADHWRRVCGPATIAVAGPAGIAGERVPSGGLPCRLDCPVTGRGRAAAERAVAAFLVRSGLPIGGLSGYSIACGEAQGRPFRFGWCSPTGAAHGPRRGNRGDICFDAAVDGRGTRASRTTARCCR